MRMQPFAHLTFAAAMALCATPDVAVEIGDHDRPPAPPRPEPEPREPTAADLERLRQAAERRARKVSKQARGFALSSEAPSGCSVSSLASDAALSSTDEPLQTPHHLKGEP